MILVTGATGTTGREIGPQLSVARAQVHAWVRHAEQASALMGPGVERVTADLEQPEILDAAVKAVECALLLPANTPRPVEQEQHVIEAATQADTPQVVKDAASIRQRSPRSRGGDTMRVQGAKGLGFAVVLLSVGLWLLPLSASALEVGDKAPDFLLHSTVGETVRLSDYQGKKHVLLFFFLAAFTGV
jgi:NAD(P)H-binding/AhpC/TSA family